MLVRVVVGLVTGIVAGSMGLSESSGKTSQIVSYSTSNPMRLSLWSAWKEKVIGGGDLRRETGKTKT